MKYPKESHHTTVCELWMFTSLMACSWHFINSVGHRVKDEKNAARNPADAFPNIESLSTLWKNKFCFIFFICTRHFLSESYLNNCNPSNVICRISACLDTLPLLPQCCTQTFGNSHIQQIAQSFRQHLQL